MTKIYYICMHEIVKGKSLQKERTFLTSSWLGCDSMVECFESKVWASYPAVQKQKRKGRRKERRGGVEKKEERSREKWEGEEKIPVYGEMHVLGVSHRRDPSLLS